MKKTKGSYNVFIGDVALDEYYRADRWPGLSDKENVTALEAIPGGQIANAACVSASLGADTMFLTVLNDSAISKFLLDDLRSYGIDTSLSITDSTLADSKTMIFLVGDENTIFIPTLDVPVIEISPETLDVLKNAGYIYSTCNTLSTLSLGNRNWDSLAEEIRGAGAKIAVDYDVDYERNGDEHRFENVDIGFFNETGFDAVRGQRPYADEVARLFELGMETVVVTLGEKGCRVFSGEEDIYVPARNVDVVDAVGAGDTFCSSFIFALQSMKLREAAEFATAAASICISSMGARSGAVPASEVLKLIER